MTFDLPRIKSQDQRVWGFDHKAAWCCSLLSYTSPSPSLLPVKISVISKSLTAVSFRSLLSSAANQSNIKVSATLVDLLVLSSPVTPTQPRLPVVIN